MHDRFTDDEESLPSSCIVTSFSDCFKELLSRMQLRAQDNEAQLPRKNVMLQNLCKYRSIDCRQCTLGDDTPSSRMKARLSAYTTERSSLVCIFNKLSWSRTEVQGGGSESPNAALSDLLPETAKGQFTHFNVPFIYFQIVFVCVM
ncbi:hypothetical protein NDU88_002178 [Pleurodeles waltl]|uniref:Uncharacterized protein n=1 Tax=Pleurodeles waltl TaxID=8319 RepID=A0AAV7LBT8_PLEWA|nr:hypothetical protein NDU88_002178 [Pleurodeles waltl]